MNHDWKRDVVEAAQKVMNDNKSLENKNLISSLANEVIALRCEIERLEKLLTPTAHVAKWPRVLVTSLDSEGRVESCQWVEKVDL